MNGFWVMAAIVAVVAAIVVSVIGALAGWWTRKYTLDQLIALLEPSIRLYKPDGPGPFPAILQVHGCGGAKAIQDEYATAARDVGALVVVLDSLKPRRISYETALKKVCSGRILRGLERTGDVVAGLELLRRRSDVDASRLAVIGWSHGGWTIMDLMALNLAKQRPPSLKNLPSDVWKGVVAIELIYPFCGFPALTRVRGWTTTHIPVDALLVENDGVAPPKETQRAFEKARASGAQIDVETWSGVTHAFEESEHPKGSRCRYDASRAAEAHRRYAAWARRVFGL